MGTIVLNKIIKISGYIKCKTGLHIGGANDSFSIGGIDTPVIKDPLSNLPYIPGSSLKGKIRTLLEYKFDEIKNNGPHYCENNNPDCEICRIFGSGKPDKNKEIGPTRAIFRDAFLENAGNNFKTEEKIENAINRINLRANPRHIERVPAGSIFSFEIIYRVFDKKDEENLDFLLYGLRLLQDDYLGGSGSRGYGRIVFMAKKEDNKEGKVKIYGIDGKEEEDLNNIKWIKKTHNENI